LEVSGAKAGDHLVITAAGSTLSRMLIGAARKEGIKTIGVVRRPEAVQEVKSSTGWVWQGGALGERGRRQRGTGWGKVRGGGKKPGGWTGTLVQRNTGMCVCFFGGGVASVG
jgi:hypothetical protein